MMDQAFHRGILTNDPTKYPLSIKGVLAHTIDGTLHVLFLRNERNEWELPGGRPEPGETPEECLSRELMEEAGLRVNVGPLIYTGVLTIRPPDVQRTTQVSICAYTCSLEHSDSKPILVLSGEHCGASWICIEDLGDMDDVPEIYKTAVLAWKPESGQQMV